MDLFEVLVKLILKKFQIFLEIKNFLITYTHVHTRVIYYILYIINSELILIYQLPLLLLLLNTRARESRVFELVR